MVLYMQSSNTWTCRRKFNTIFILNRPQNCPEMPYGKNTYVPDYRCINFGISLYCKIDTGVKFFIGSKVQCMFCFEICTPEDRGGEKRGSANFKTRHTEPLRQEIPSALYCTPEGRGREKGGSANFHRTYDIIKPGPL